MKVKIFKLLFFVITFNSYARIRDPFSIKSREQYGFFLSALVEVNGKQFALLNFNIDSEVVGLDDIAFEKWKIIKFIDEQSIELKNVSTNQHKILTLSN